MRIATDLQSSVDECSEGLGEARRWRGPGCAESQARRQCLEEDCKDPGCKEIEKPAGESDVLSPECPAKPETCPGAEGCTVVKTPTCWRTVFDMYRDVLKVKGSQKKKLAELDKWYQEELPLAIGGRKEKYLTLGEVVKLMEWKLARGKFRPRLQELVATNSSETVESCTRKAFQLLPDVAAAITELSQLKAVGPATASAILAAGAPETVAFMADEAMESIPGLTPIQYTLKHYILYLDKIQLCVKKLSKADTETAWTPHRVEMCLWAWAVAQKLCPSLLQALSLGGEKAADEDVRPTKKRKSK